MAQQESCPEARPILPSGDATGASILQGADVVRPQRPLFTPSRLIDRPADARGEPSMACGGQEVHLEGVCLHNSKPSIVHMSFKRLWQECSNHYIGDHSQSVNHLSSPLLPSF